MHRGGLIQFQTAVAAADWPTALKIIENLIAAMPDNASLHYNRGLVLKYLERLNEALSAFEKALQHDPDHAHASFEWAASLFNIGRLEEAVSAFVRYLKTSPGDVDAELNVGMALLRLNRANEALAHLRTAHALSGSTEAALALAAAERDLGHLEQAAAWLAGLGQEDPEVAAVMLKIRTQGAKGHFYLGTT